MQSVKINWYGYNRKNEYGHAFVLITPYWKLTIERLLQLAKQYQNPLLYKRFETSSLLPTKTKQSMTRYDNRYSTIIIIISLFFFTLFPLNLHGSQVSSVAIRTINISISIQNFVVAIYVSRHYTENVKYKNIHILGKLTLSDRACIAAKGSASLATTRMISDLILLYHM